MTASPLTTRFAPSPTGYLHLGHAFSALTAFAAARRAGGRFILRIEDIDQTRCHPAFEDAIYEDLSWLGLEWETPVMRQSDRLENYRNTVEALRARGLIYRCFKTRKEVAQAISSAPHAPPAGPEGPAYRGGALPPAEERALLNANAPFAWRLSLDAARNALGERYAQLTFTVEDESGDGRRISHLHHADPAMFGDIVIARKDSGVSYHLASVYDDAAQGVTHVIRGEDLAQAPHIHVLLQALFDLPTPIYRHHHLITDENGKRLAKRDKAATLRALREAGAHAGDIRARFGFD